jgi:polyhydroxybutyrate depolymerase
MKVILIFASLLVLQFAATQTNSSINHNGLNRTFVYYAPSSWNQSQQLPLLMLLHGLTQTGSGVMNITDFNQIAEQNNFIVCYPDGINNAWNANMNVTVSTADDKGFIETLAQHFQINFNTNPLKQYLCGFSNGGFMSHKMACESSECFAAIATVSGNMSDTTYNNCNPKFNPSVLHIHGTSDAIVSYNGSSSTGVSVDSTMQKWAGFLNCNSIPTSAPMPNTSSFDLSSPERITYSNCNSPLELIKITGGGHQWPGISTLIGGAGIINMDFYSPQVIWDFLSGKSCPTNSLDKNELSAIEFAPNPVTSNIKIQSNETFEYVIINTIGLTMDSGKMKNEINLSHLPVGIYYMELSNHRGSKQFKFVKE